MAGTKLDPKQYLEDATRDSLARLTRLLNEIAPPDTLIGTFPDAEMFLLKDLADRLEEIIEPRRRSWDQYCQDMLGPPVSHARISDDEDDVFF